MVDDFFQMAGGEAPVTVVDRLWGDLLFRILTTSQQQFGSILSLLKEMFKSGLKACITDYFE